MKKVNEPDDLEFDFSGKKERKQKEMSDNQNAIKTQHFRKMVTNFIAVAGIVAVVGGSGFGMYSMHEKHIDNKIQEANTLVSKSDQGAIMGLMQREMNVAQQTYTKNQLLINKYGEYSELVEALNLNRDLAVKNTQNTRLYNQTVQSLNNDKVAVNKVFDVTNKTRDAKINEWLDSADFNKFQDWTKNVQNNQFMYVGGLMDLNNDLTKQIQSLEQTKEEIIQNVQTRIKNKDYNLDSAQANFSNQIATDSASQVQDLKDAKAQIQDAQLARTDNNESVDNNMNQLLTDSDIQNATTASNEIEQAAMDQVKQDKNKVEALIAQAGSPANASGAVSNNQANNQSGQAPQVVNNYYGSTQPHLSFFDYYLMYNWMNSGSNNTYHTTYVNNTAPSAGTYKTPIPMARSNLYDVKNSNSYVSKTIVQSPSIKGSSYQGLNNINTARPNLSAMRAQIDTATSKASQARSWRSAEFSRMGISSSERGGSYKGGSYRSSATHISAAHEGGFGHGGSAHSSGFSHSSGFGHGGSAHGSSGG